MCYLYGIRTQWYPHNVLNALNCQLHFAPCLTVHFCAYTTRSQQQHLEGKMCLNLNNSITNASESLKLA